MGSSVDNFCVLCLWITACKKKERTNHTIGKL